MNHSLEGVLECNEEKIAYFQQLTEQVKDIHQERKETEWTYRQLFLKETEHIQEEKLDVLINLLQLLPVGLTSYELWLTAGEIGKGIKREIPPIRKKRGDTEKLKQYPSLYAAYEEFVKKSAGYYNRYMTVAIEFYKQFVKPTAKDKQKSEELMKHLPNCMIQLSIFEELAQKEKQK